MAIGRKQAIVRGAPRHSLNSQINMARAAGCDVIHVLDKKAPRAADIRPTTFENAVRTIREVDTIVLPYPYVLGDPACCKRGKVRELFDDRMDAITDRQPLVIIDLANNLRSDDKAEWRLMLKLGRNGATSGGIGVKSAENAKRGRTVYNPSPEIEAAAKAIWLNLRDYPTWTDVRKALPKGVTAEYCYRNKEWGGARTRKSKT